MKNTTKIQSTLKKYLFLVPIISALIACTEHTEDDGHDHRAEEKPAGDACCATKFSKIEKNHEAEAVIASLTHEQIKAVGIVLAPIEERQLSATIKANGSISVANNFKASVTSLYGGVIKTINVQLGAYVRKGQVIATISHPQYLHLQEEYLTLTSKITYAEQEVQRQNELNEGNAGATKNLQSATAELSSLRTRQSSLRQQLQLMGINTSKISSGNFVSSIAITSPINGTVSNVMARIGAYTDASSPVAELVDASQLHVDLSVFEKDLPLLKNGQIIHFRITNNPSIEYIAKIYAIGTAFEQASKTIAVHATIQGNKTGLIDGMSVTAAVSLNNITSLAVPNDAIVSSEGKDYIFIVTDKKPEEHHEEENKEEQQPHDEVMTNFEKIEIIKGVSSMGYTATTSFLVKIPKSAKIVAKGAFFVDAKLTNQGEGHSH